MEFELAPTFSAGVGFKKMRWDDKAALLHSATWRTSWHERTLRATCSYHDQPSVAWRRPSPPPGHAIPHRLCTCGVWAYKRLPPPVERAYDAWWMRRLDLLVYVGGHVIGSQLYWRGSVGTLLAVLDEHVHATAVADRYFIPALSREELLRYAGTFGEDRGDIVRPVG